MTTPAPTPVNLDLNNIQGDILSGFPKKTETFYFFQILDPTKFRKDLRDFVPIIKTVAQVLKDREEIDKHKKKKDPSGRKPPTIPLVGVNIAFSHLGFTKLGIDDSKLIDQGNQGISTGFLDGQRKDAQSLGDRGSVQGTDFVPDWDEEFKQDIHGVLNIAGDSHATVDRKVQLIEQCFKVGTKNATIKKVTSIRGDTRPGDQDGHEQYVDRGPYSLPVLTSSAFSASDTSMVFLTLRSSASTRTLLLAPLPFVQAPSSLDRTATSGRTKGTHGRLTEASSLSASSSRGCQNSTSSSSPTDSSFPASTTKREPTSSERGSSGVGRAVHLSTCPPSSTTLISLDSSLYRRNNFHFSAERNFQKLCPFAAHIRKTLPRADLEENGISIEKNRIMRRGIQFGPEVTRRERQNKKTEHGRGLLFACYQSNLSSGFQFIQKSWANNPNFPPFEQTPETPGLDPIIGQTGQDDRGPVSGVNPNTPSITVALKEEWVVSRGGEYFFSPSIKALKETIALPA